MREIYEVIKKEVEELASGDSSTCSFLKDFNEIINKYKVDKNFIYTFINLLEQSVEEIPWSIINASNDNFELAKDNIFRHKRDYFLINSSEGILNTNSIKMKVRKEYIEKQNKEIYLYGSYTSKVIPKYELPIYISKGGIVNGDYINQTYIKNFINEDKLLVVKYPITIPIIMITTSDDKVYFVVDHREPKLAEVMHDYRTPIMHDDDVKFNIRKFIK